MSARAAPNPRRRWNVMLSVSDRSVARAALPDDPVYQRGVRFLLDTQQEDGSWWVKTRSDPIQIYYESGFPHGKDQWERVFYDPIKNGF